MLWLQSVSCAVGCLCAVDRAVVLDRVNVSWFPHEQHVFLPRDRAQRQCTAPIGPGLFAVCVLSLLAAVPCAGCGCRAVVVVVCLAGSCVCVLLTRCFCFVVDLFFRGPCTFELSVSCSFLVSFIHVVAAGRKFCCWLFVCG